MKNAKKIMALLLAVVLLVGAVVGGTLAWFTDKTQKVENTFTVGNIDIELEETDNGLDSDESADTNDYKMIPGWTIEKDPTVSVAENSEDCYLFVKLEKGNDFDSFMEYAMADGWTALETGVYYRVVKTTDETRSFAVIKGNKVTVKTDVTAAMMNALTDREDYPTLDVTAYAVQYWKDNTTPFAPAAAWEIAKS